MCSTHKKFCISKQKKKQNIELEYGCYISELGD